MATELDDEPEERPYLLNCRNCHWWTVVVASAYMQVDYVRDCHEESLRNALSVGPYCPKRAVAIVRLPDAATTPEKVNES